MVADGGKDDAQPGRRPQHASGCPRWWQLARAGLTLLEIVAAARRDIALAATARAMLVVGDVILRVPRS